MKFTPHDEALLERVKVRAITRINPELLPFSIIAVSDFERWLSDELCVTLSTRIYQQDLGILERPATLWQAFRERWMPTWWLRRYPVLMERYTLSAIYPTFNPMAKPYGIRVEPVEPDLDSEP